jgi:hypothetical protein
MYRQGMCTVHVVLCAIEPALCSLCTSEYGAATSRQTWYSVCAFCACTKMRKMLLTGPTIVVADEAHEMKNAQSQFYQAMREIKTPRRVALTGYPLQVCRPMLLGLHRTVDVGCWSVARYISVQSSG